MSADEAEAKADSAISLLCHLLDQILGPRTYDADPARNEAVVNKAILEVRRLRQENERLSRPDGRECAALYANGLIDENGNPPADWRDKLRELRLRGC